MSDPKIAATFGGGASAAASFGLTTADNNNRMLLPSLTTTTDETLRNAPKLLVPPVPTRRRSSTATPISHRSPSGSIAEQTDAARRTSFLPSTPSETKPSVDEITELLKERRQRIKRKK